MRTQPAYSNKHKLHLNKFYCYSCGYDVDHDGYNCPINYQKQNHLPHITRDNAHLIEGASMKAQHKTLPDGTGAGQGWVLERNLGKARYTMQKREEWIQQQQRGPQRGTSTWANNERPAQPPNPQWRAQAPAPAQQQANHAYQMPAYGPPTPYPPQWSQQQGPPHYPNGPSPHQGAPWGQGYL
jgi:hypothetical protein